MTMFETLCVELGVPHNSEAEYVLSEMVNEMIFADIEYTDDEIFATVCKQFKEKYL